MKAIRQLAALWREISRHASESQLSITASSLAYTTILSIVPMLALSFVIFRALGGADRIYERIEPLVLSNLVRGAGTAVLEKFRASIDQASARTLGITGLLGLLITSLSLLTSIDNAFQRIWRIHRNRGPLTRLRTYLLIILLGPFALSVSIAVETSWGIGLNRILPKGVPFAIAALALTAAYKFVPNTKVAWRFATLSGTSTALLLGITSSEYSLYLRHFASFKRIYGSLAAIPITIFGIYLFWVLVLGGAALTAALQDRSERPVRSKSS